MAVEDARFYEHGGIDLRGIARALVKDVVKGKMAEGGSTITQQLIKNKYLSSKKTLERKFEESLMALEFERKFTKKQILEMYFNESLLRERRLGHRPGRPPLFRQDPAGADRGRVRPPGGGTQSPGALQPPGEAAQRPGDRKSFVLKRMMELKMITAARAKKVRLQPIPVIAAGEGPVVPGPYPHQADRAVWSGDHRTGGLEVTAAMDLNLQKQAEQVLRDGVRRISPKLQGALIALDPATGDVLAAVGGADFEHELLQPRLFCQAAARLGHQAADLCCRPGKGISPPAASGTTTPVAYIAERPETWKPLNYGNEHYGNLTLRQALAHSNNVITVKLLEAIGVPDFIDFAGRLGLPCARRTAFPWLWEPTMSP